MDEQIIKRKMLDFLTMHELCVISTIHADREAPESAVVGFGQTEELEIIISTSNTSRKYANIQKNPHVSLVIGWDGRVGTIQYEGVAKEVAQDDVEKYSQFLIEKNIDNSKFVKQSDIRYFIIKPSWIRFIDNAGDPPGKHEIDFS